MGGGGGGYCEDVDGINSSPHRHVKIQGIDNHKITSVLIAAFLSLSHSQCVPVITITNQYKWHVKGKITNYSV